MEIVAVQGWRDGGEEGGKAEGAALSWPWRRGSNGEWQSSSHHRNTAAAAESLSQYLGTVVP